MSLDDAFSSLGHGSSRISIRAASSAFFLFSSGFPAALGSAFDPLPVVLDLVDFLVSFAGSAKAARAAASASSRAAASASSRAATSASMRAAASASSFLTLSSSSLFSFSLASLVLAAEVVVPPKLPQMPLAALAGVSSLAVSFFDNAFSTFGLTTESTCSSLSSLALALSNFDNLPVMVVERERVPFLVLLFVLVAVSSAQPSSSNSGIAAGPGSGVNPCAGGVGAGGGGSSLTFLPFFFLPAAPHEPQISSSRGVSSRGATFSTGMIGTSTVGSAVPFFLPSFSFLFLSLAESPHEPQVDSSLGSAASFREGPGSWITGSGLADLPFLPLFLSFVPNPPQLSASSTISEAGGGGGGGGTGGILAPLGSTFFPFLSFFDFLVPKAQSSSSTTVFEVVVFVSAAVVDSGW